MRCVALTLLAACGSASSGPKCTTRCDPLRLSTLSLLAGQPGGQGWVDGAGAVAHFEDPWTFASDGQGRLFLADGNLVRAIDEASGQVTTLAGSATGVSGGDGVGDAASFYIPSGLAFTGGALYVTDTENHTLRKLDPATRSVTTIAGAAGQPGSSDGQASLARFREPEGLAADNDGNLYLADTDNNIIRKLVLASGEVTTLAGLAEVNGSSDGIGTAARFFRPKAMIFDGVGSLYICDNSNQSIRRLSLADGAVTTVASFSTVPVGLAAAGGDLLVSLGDNTIVRVSNGVTTVLVGSAGTAGFVDGDAPLLHSPAGLFLDGSTLFIADDQNYAIRRFDLSAMTLSTFAGARSSGSRDGAGSEARFWGIGGLAGDADFVYAADIVNHTIRKIDLAGGAVTTLAGTAGQSGTSDGTGAEARFNLPADVALDGRNLYVVDTSNQYLRKIDLDSAAVSTLVAQPMGDFTYLASASGIAFDSDQLFIADGGHHVIAALDLKTSTIRVLSGKNGVAGTADGNGGAARWASPAGIRADGLGHLFVADQGNHTIRRVDLAGGAVTTLAGQPGIQGNDDGQNASFAFPSAVAVGGAGEIFVADSLNHLVRRIDPSGVVSTVAGSRSASGVMLGALPAQITQPSSLSVTAAGELLIASENSLLVAH